MAFSETELMMIEEKTLNMFNFLITDKGFDKKVLIKRHHFHFDIIYKITEMSIEIALDCLDNIINVNLVKMFKGKLPKYQTNTGTDGERIRNPLDLLLLHLKIATNDIMLDQIMLLHKTPFEKKDVHHILTALNLYGLLLIKYIDVLREQPMEILFPKVTS